MKHKEENEVVIDCRIENRVSSTPQTSHLIGIHDAGA